MKRVDLDKLESELEKWRGEVPLPCDIVVSMISELRAYRNMPDVLSPEDSEAFQQLLNAEPRIVAALARAMRERRKNRAPQGAPRITEGIATEKLGRE